MKRFLNPFSVLLVPDPIDPIIFYFEWMIKRGYNDLINLKAIGPMEEAGCFITSVLSYNEEVYYEAFYQNHIYFFRDLSN